MSVPRYEFRSTARVGPSGHGWPYSGDQGLVTIVGPTVIVPVLPTLAANTGNQRCAQPSAELWPRLEPTLRANLGELPYMTVIVRLAHLWSMVEPIVDILLTRLYKHIVPKTAHLRHPASGQLFTLMDG